MNTTTLALCFHLTLAVIVPPVAPPDFSGTWVRDPARSDALPPTEKAKAGDKEVIMTVVQEGDALRVETRWGDTRPTRREYKVDGKPNSMRNPEGGDISYSASWEGEKLVIMSSRLVATPFGEVEIQTEEEWSLSEDGKTLTITTRNLGGFSAQVTKQIYSKR